MAEHIRVPRSNRMKTSIWIDRGLWTWYVPWIKALGDSSCGPLEAFLYALKTGASQIPARSPLPAVNVTLNLTREVQRYRRRERISDFPVFDDWGSHLVCHFCRRRSRWLVYYAVGWDRTIRVYCCGYHVRQYRSMTSLPQGWPRISIQKIS